MKRTPTQREVMDIRQLCEYTTISKTVIREKVALYQMPFTRIGRRLVFCKRHIDQWLDQQTIWSAKDDVRKSRHQEGANVLA